MAEPWVNNILSFEPEVDPTQLLAHPLNARRHPGAQRDALRESLGRAGWVDVVKVNTRTGHVVDGHARVEEAISAGASVPVLYLDLSEEDERFVLATLDPIGALAEYDNEVLTQLLEGLEIESTKLAGFIQPLTQPDVEWVGMPDFSSEDMNPAFSIRVHFYTPKDQADFFKLIDRPQAKTIYWPESDGFIGSDARVAYISDDQTDA
jgi:hypothetical protein